MHNVSRCECFALRPCVSWLLCTLYSCTLSNYCRLLNCLVFFPIICTQKDKRLVLAPPFLLSQLKLRHKWFLFYLNCRRFMTTRLPKVSWDRALTVVANFSQVQFDEIIFIYQKINFSFRDINACVFFLVLLEYSFGGSQNLERRNV